MNIFKSLFKLFFNGKQKKRYQPPDSLSQEAMEKVMREVNFLRAQHAVDVRELEAGEIPSVPKRAE
jgi:phage terminase small subunit